MPAFQQPKILTARQQQQLLNNCRSRKYRVIILLMLDGGLRITEVIRLQLKHINFLENYILVESLNIRRSNRPPAPEKPRSTQLEISWEGQVIRSEDRHRKIPLTQRLLNALNTYWPTLKKVHPEAYLFPGSHQNKSGYLSRRQVWRQIKKLSSGHIYPQMLRRTFASRIVSNGNDIRVAQKLLGYKSGTATGIYPHLPDAQARAAILSIERRSLWSRLQGLLQSSPSTFITPMEWGLTQFHVGRKAELARLADLARKRINILITGPQGIGKTHLLDNYKQDNIIRLGDMSSTKRLLAGLLIHLFQTDKAHIAKQLFKEELDPRELSTIVYRATIKKMTDWLIQITRQQEYTLAIDDVTRITPTGISALEKLKNHFHIICAARHIKISAISFLSNFERIDLTPLSRPDSVELINRLAKPLLDHIEDYEAFKNHIYENTNGNPLFIIEMVERYRKEDNLSDETVKNYRHTAAFKEFDVSIIIVITLSSLMVLRYVSSEIGDDSGAYRLIGGVFLMFALFARNIFRVGKRRFL